MAEKTVQWFQEKYDRLNRMGKKQETVMIWGFCFLLVFAVVIGTGTLTSGFHLVDDWEMAKYADWMKLEHKSLWECLKQAVGYDLTMRFRPLYYINRVLMAAVFGINLTAVSVVKAIEIVTALVALYYCARQMECNPVYALLFSLTVMVGYQSPVWWKLGPQESYDIMMFAIGFYFLLKWLHTDRRGYAYASVGAFFLMSVYKEPFILLLPFVCLYVLYYQMKGKKVTLSNLWAAIKERLPYYLTIGVMFALEMFLILFVIGTNNYDYVGLDSTLNLEDYKQAWSLVAQTDLKWYVRFGMVMLLILLTYWEQLKRLGWEILLALSIVLPQCISYSKTGIAERYILPAVVGFAFFFVVVGCSMKALSGKRRIAYILCLLLMLAAHGRIMLREAAYFTYRGESIKTMMETTLEKVQGTDKKVLSCFYPNLEANRTMYYWFRLHDYDEFYYWEEDRQVITREFGEREDEKEVLEHIDIVVMYNEEDRHWCYTPSLDLSDFTEQKCGTITMYIRNEE